MQKFNVKFKFANSDQEIGIDQIDSFEIVAVEGNIRTWTVTSSELNKLVTVKKPQKKAKIKEEIWWARYSQNKIRVLSRDTGGKIGDLYDTVLIETIGVPDSKRWIRESSLIKSYTRVE